MIHRNGFRDVHLIIITTFLDAQEYLPEDLAELYWQRWQVELDFRSIKETMRMGELRCKTPAMVRKELWVHLLAYNLIRGMIARRLWNMGRDLAKSVSKERFKPSMHFGSPFAFPRHTGDLPTTTDGDRYAPRRRPSWAGGASGKETSQEKLCGTHATSPPSPKAFHENNLKPRKCHWGNALGYEFGPFGPYDKSCYATSSSASSTPIADLWIYSLSWSSKGFCLSICLWSANSR